jgi:threonine dehydrogenase-like Zn-dependent dehydrogenase
VPILKSFGAIHPQNCSDIRTCSVVSLGAKRNISGCRFADVGPTKMPESLTDEQVLFLSDIFPTGYMAAEFCNIQPGDTIAVWGCGPVGQLAIASAFLLGASRVIAIDTVPERLALAQRSGAETLDFQKDDIYSRIQDLTKGRGADACIDAIGTEPETTASKDSVVDRIKVATFLGTDRPHVLREAITCCRNFGTVSIVGVYGGYSTKSPWAPRLTAA